MDAKKRPSVSAKGVNPTTDGVWSKAKRENLGVKDGLALWNRRNLKRNLYKKLDVFFKHPISK